MDPIKEAFQKIKEEIISLKLEISTLKEQIQFLASQNHSQIISSNSTQNPSTVPNQTDNPSQIKTVPQEIRGLEVTNKDSSTGNKGAPTDTSTDRQTHQQTDNSIRFLLENTVDMSPNIRETLTSLDAIKKELRLKFKRLTTQEMLVFSTLYSLETQGFEEISYKVIANNLNLSESSIRDYISKLISKGIPIIKRRLNNKQISLNISSDLQKIASLATLTRLREL